MTAGNTPVKATAKAALNDNWLRAIMSSLVPAFSVVINYLLFAIVYEIYGAILSALAFALMFFFFTLPLLLGFLKFIWRMLFGMKDSPTVVFYYFSGKTFYLRALKLEFALAIRALGYAAIFYIPVMAVMLISSEQIYDMLGMAIPMWTTNLSHILVFIETLTTVLLFFAMIKYYLSPVLVVADDNMEIAEAIHMSRTVSKKTTADFVYLFFGLFGWILLSFLILPILYTAPYLTTSYAVHVRFAVADYNKHIKKANEDKFPSFEVGI